MINTKYYWALIALLLLPVTAFSLTLDDIPVIKLDGKYTIFTDPSAKIKLEEIKLLQSQAKFTSISDNLSAGYVPDAYWLYFSLSRSESQPAIWWLEVIPTFLDDIQFYHITPQNKMEYRQGGDFKPQSTKEENYRGSIFKLDLTAGKHEFYIRLKTTSTMAAVMKLWQPEAFNQSLRNSYFIFGIYFSLIFTVFIFNSFNFLFYRKIIFLVYAGYLFLNAIQWLGINGFISEFIFPEQPLLANLALGMSLSLSASMAFVFFALVFELRKYHPYIFLITPVGTVLGLLTAIATPLGYYQLFVPWLFLVAIASLITAPWFMFRLWRSHEVWNRVVAVGYSAYMVLITINILGALSLLAYNELNIYIGMSSNIFHILVLHFAIVMHYRNIEKAHSQAVIKVEYTQKQVVLEKAFNKEQSQLLAMITHEIRTPIAIIDAANKSLELIDQMDSNSPEDRTKRYQRIQRAVMRMNMVMDMALAQKDNKSLPFVPEQINLMLLTKEVVELSGSEAEQRVQLDCEMGNINIMADIRLMRIALLNLVDNALKYSPKKTPVTICIQSLGDLDKNLIIWTIEDQGIGIPAGMEEKIFEKFIRGDERANQPGMGLGLFLVSNIITRHDGNISVWNNVNGGASFSLLLVPV